MKDIEDLKKRTEKELTALLEKLKIEDKAVYQAKKKFAEFHEEIIEVEKVVNRYIDEINDMRQHLATLSVSKHASDVHKTQAKISDASIELAKWTELKRDFNLALTKQDMVYRRCANMRDATRATYIKKKETFDMGIGHAFDDAIEIGESGAAARPP